MVIVYVWLPGDQGMGHASMLLDEGAPRSSVYISWWPTNDTKGGVYCSPAHRTRSFSDDKRGEGKDPDHTIHLLGLNEPAIGTAWDNWRAADGDWCTLARNCSTLVARMLDAGGGENFSSWCASFSVVWRPKTVLAYARSIAAGLDPARQREAAERARAAVERYESGRAPAGARLGE